MTHILFKLEKQDLFSRGKTYEGSVCDAYRQWEIEFPDATFIGLYPHNKN